MTLHSLKLFVKSPRRGQPTDLIAERLAVIDRLVDDTLAALNRYQDVPAQQPVSVRTAPSQSVTVTNQTTHSVNARSAVSAPAESPDGILERGQYDRIILAREARDKAYEIRKALRGSVL